MRAVQCSGRTDSLKGACFICVFTSAVMNSKGSTRRMFGAGLHVWEPIFWKMEHQTLMSHATDTPHNNYQPGRMKAVTCFLQGMHSQPTAFLCCLLIKSADTEIRYPLPSPLHKLTGACDWLPGSGERESKPPFFFLPSLRAQANFALLNPFLWHHRDSNSQSHGEKPNAMATVFLMQAYKERG